MPLGSREKSALTLGYKTKRGRTQLSPIFTRLMSLCHDSAVANFAAPPRSLSLFLTIIAPPAPMLFTFTVHARESDAVCSHDALTRSFSTPHRGSIQTSPYPLQSPVSLLWIVITLSALPTSPSGPPFDIVSYFNDVRVFSPRNGHSFTGSCSSRVIAMTDQRTLGLPRVLLSPLWIPQGKKSFSQFLPLQHSSGQDSRSGGQRGNFFNRNLWRSA